MQAEREECRYPLFKHKRKIVLCTLAGLIAQQPFQVISIWFTSPEAKLLVRYVLDRRR
jgi:hypothetical protein